MDVNWLPVVFGLNLGVIFGCFVGDFVLIPLVWFGLGLVGDAWCLGVDLNLFWVVLVGLLFTICLFLNLFVWLSLFGVWFTLGGGCFDVLMLFRFVCLALTVDMLSGVLGCSIVLLVYWLVDLLFWLLWWFIWLLSSGVCLCLLLTRLFCGCFCVVALGVGLCVWVAAWVAYCGL